MFTAGRAATVEVGLTGGQEMIQKTRALALAAMLTALALASSVVPVLAGRFTP